MVNLSGNIVNTNDTHHESTGCFPLVTTIKSEPQDNTEMCQALDVEPFDCIANTTRDVKTESDIANITHDVKTESDIANTTHDVKTEPDIANTASNDFTIIAEIQMLSSAGSDVETKSCITNTTRDVKTESDIANTTHDVKTEPDIANTASNDFTIIAEIQIPTTNTWNGAEYVMVNTNTDIETDEMMTKPMCDAKTVPITDMMVRSTSDAVIPQPISGPDENTHIPQGDEQECGEPSRASRQVPVSGQEPLVCDGRGVRTVQGEHTSFPTSECDNSIVREHDVTKQKRTQAGHKQFACDLCMKTFAWQCDLTVHQRIHTGEKPFACNECMKTFAQQGNLTVHQRIHTGEKPFACDECVKTFVRQGDLTVHQRIHTGEKPYVCDVCMKAFAHPSNFKVHQRIHTG